MKPYPFQEEGIAWLRTREMALLADEPGLGKTVQAITAAVGEGARSVLMVVPASLKYVWDREIRQWTGEENIQVISGGKTKIEFKKWTIINYDLLLNPDIYRQLVWGFYDVGVFDEAHYLKTRTSKRTKLVLLRGGLASRCKRKWFLTGTPILNRPVELYPLLKACAPEVMSPFNSYTGYTRYFCGGFMDGISWNDRGATHVDELNDRLAKSGFMKRRLKEDVLKDLPPKTFEVIPVDVKQREEFKFLWQKDSTTKFNLGDFFNEDTTVGAVAEARHYVALEKVKVVIPHIKNLLLEQEKVVVFAHHRDVVAKLMEGLEEYNPVKIVGGMGAEAKNDSQQRFQNDPDCRILVGNIMAAGTGFTLTKAFTAVFAEIDWTPGYLLQASDRIHRIGQDKPCVIQMFVTRDSIEEYMLRRLVEKKDVCDRVLVDKEYIFS